MKRFLQVLVMLLLSTHGFAQKKMISKLFSSDNDSSRTSSFLPLPALGYAQETGFEFGVVPIYSFYMDKEDPLTRNSSITGVATFTTKKQTNLQLKTDIWSRGNNWHYLTDLRYRNFPFNFYGVGSNTREADLDKVDLKLSRVSAEVEKRISKSYFAGVNAGFDQYRFVDQAAGGIYSTSPLIYDRDGGKLLFVGLSQILDSRNSNTYTTQGSYLKFNYSYAPDLFGGENFEGTLTKVDFRTFKQLKKQTVVGFNVVYQTIQGDKVPFYLLPQLGNDNVMRGYYTGRYRDQNLLALQAEMRYRFSPRFGVAGFAGAGSVYKSGFFRIEDFKPSLGGGFRYFFDVERGLSVRLDYGVGEKRAGEKRQTGFYISVGEAF